MGKEVLGLQKGEKPSHFSEWRSKSTKDRKDAYVLALRTQLRAQYQGEEGQSEGLVMVLKAFVQSLLILSINFSQQVQVEIPLRDVMKQNRTHPYGRILCSC